MFSFLKRYLYGQKYWLSVLNTLSETKICNFYHYESLPVTLMATPPAMDHDLRVLLLSQYSKTSIKRTPN